MKLCFQLLLVAIVLVEKSFAQPKNPLKDPNICGRPGVCKEESETDKVSKFKYGPNTQHIYNYTVDISSLFNGTSKNESTLHISSTLTVDFLSTCDGQLTFSDVVISEDRVENGQVLDEEDDWSTTDNGKLFAETLEESPVRFAFSDGNIYEVCPSDEETTWALNIKKGALSMLHNTMKRLDLDHSGVEEDVRGKCKTEYKIIGAEGTSLVIEKNKDLSTCEGKSKLESMVQSTPYAFKTKFQQSENLLKSHSSCRFYIDHNIYKTISCQERHILEPFANRDAGASTLVRQRLILAKEISESRPELPEVTRRTALRFDHSPTPKPKHAELKIARDLIKEMCKLAEDDQQILFSQVFTKCIHTLRFLSYPAIVALHEHSGRACPKGKEHLIDALPYVGTGASLTLMKDLILRDAISPATLDDWMLATAFTARPDQEMMEPAADLLQNIPQPTPSIAFGIAALTRTYCKHQPECRREDAVLEIIETLQTRVSTGYQRGTKDRSVRDDILVALRAISNIGIITDDFEGTLKEIVEDTSSELEVRIAAIEAHRRLPCEESRSFFERIFRDEEQDSEVRIASYLQIMRCPGYLTIRNIYHTLAVEEINQVGAFVWSHLNNLKKSSIPSRVEVQGLLTDEDLVKKFSADIRKFSHYREGSIFFEEYNIGANYENSVIFSTSSYLPKSAMLNLTVDIFGESVNLFELNARAEGFEHYLESIFGPKGPLSSKKLQDKIPKMRWARSVLDNEIVKSGLDRLPNVMENKFGEPKVSLGLKIFGNDLKHATFEGYEEIRKALSTLNPVDQFHQIFSGKSLDYSKAAMFLDTSYVVSTGAGLPLTLNAIGTASINLKLSGSLDTSNFNSKRELDFTADIRPSLSLNLIGTMSVDAFYKETAIKLKSTMYTSSALQGQLKVRGPRVVSFNFTIPRQTSEIFGARSELIVVKKGIDEVQSGLSDRHVSRSVCSWPAVDQTIGLRLCADYNFVNVTRLPEAPYFLLAGPNGVKVSLQKSDPTANLYVFEYKYHEGYDSSYVSLTFDTPGSQLRRLLAANLTIDKQSQNLTLLLQSAAGTVLATGSYKFTEDEKYLKLSIDVNNKKHFDAIFSLNTEKTSHGYNYYPRIYIGVTEERVVELQGTLKTISKKGVSQCDVNLKFETKRLKSMLFGYISQNTGSIAANLKLDYQFIHTKEQRIALDFSLANRSPRNMLDILGTLSVYTTAYPTFNFDSRLKFKKGTGHTDCKFDLTTNPLPSDHPQAQEVKIRFQWLLLLKSFPEGRRVLVSEASLNRTSTALALYGRLDYEDDGPDITISCLGRYAPGKEVTVRAYWSHPRSTLEHWEGRINITVPGFVPMVLRGKVHENVPSHYAVEFEATWFSGHTVSARGFYKDRCNARVDDHHLKLLLKSPSFAEVITDFQYYRNDNEHKLDVKASQEKDNYGILMKRLAISQEEMRTIGKIRYKTKLYSASCLTHVGDYRRADVQLHIDQLRDIYFSVYGYNKESYKAAGFEVKWDANRDPNQKVVVSTNLTKLASFNYAGNLLLSYPGRTVVGNFDFLLKRGHINTMSRLAWSEEDSFAFSLISDYRNDYDTLFTLESLIITPFDDWRRTSVAGGYQHAGNMYHINGSVAWQGNHRVAIELFEDYFTNDTVLQFEGRSKIDSTVENIPSLGTAINHRQNATHFDTTIHVTYATASAIDIKSNWRLDKGHDSLNLTGTVVSRTPFKGFHRGFLLSKIYITRTRYIRGVADIDFDLKKTTISLEGRLKKLTNNMLEVNITTPLEEYKSINGRFGISDEKKHIVSLITYPKGQLGFEVLLQMNTITDFDIRFILGTHIEALKTVLLVAKLKPETADFRVGLNSMLAGVTCVWHYVSTMDFEYSYKVYTPLDGFEENFVIAKFVFAEGLDLETRIKLAQYKLGVKILGSPKRALLEELDIHPEDVYVGRLAKRHNTENNDGDDEAEEKPPCRWTGLVEIDAVIYPTMTGTVDIDQRGPVYFLVGKLKLPAGEAELTNEFEFIDYLTMRNELHLTTPYSSFQEASSIYHVEIVPGRQYILDLNLDYMNNTTWIKTGAAVNLGLAYGDGESNYNITLLLNTPFPIFPLLRASAFLKKTPTSYNTELEVHTSNSELGGSGSVEITQQLFDMSLQGHLTVSALRIPEVKLRLKREIGDTSVIEVYAIMPEKMKSPLTLKTTWHLAALSDFNIYVETHSPFSGFELFYSGVKFEAYDKVAKAWAVLNMHPILFESNTTLSNNVLNSISNLDLNGNRMPITISCDIIDKSEVRQDFLGSFFIKGEEHRITGGLDYEDGVPVKGLVQLTSIEPGPPLVIQYMLKPQKPQYYFWGNIKHGQKFTDVTANVTAMDTFDWKAHLEMKTSHEVYNTFLIDATSDKRETGATIDVEARSSMPKLEYSKLQFAFDSLGLNKQVKAFTDVAQQRHSLDANWIWVFLENMDVRLEGDAQTPRYNKHSTLAAFYVNPKRAFTYFKAGTDINFSGTWMAGSNLTLHIPSARNISAEGHVKLPAPYTDTHSAKGHINYEDKLRYLEYLARYQTAVSKKLYGSEGYLSQRDKGKKTANVEVDWNMKKINNLLELRQDRSRIQLFYKLDTPSYVNQSTLISEISYGSTQDYHNVTLSAFYPENKRAADINVNFKDFSNMDGKLDVTVPIKNISKAVLVFDVETNAFVYNRFIQVSWSNKTAFLDNKCNITLGPSILDKIINGVLLVEFPLTTKHAVNVTYNYKILGLVSGGKADVVYNTQKLLEGEYQCLSEERAGLNKDDVHIELRNDWAPIGVDYLYQYHYGPVNADDYTMDTKDLHLYHLTNRTKFNVSGSAVVETRSSGQRVALSATHANRTVKASTEYDILDQQLLQHSKLDLGNGTWISYKLSVLNKTQDEYSDIQEFRLDISHPGRNITCLGAYNISDTLVTSDLTLFYDPDNKTVESGLIWNSHDPSHETIELVFRHPSFEQDVILLGEYRHDSRDLLDAQVTFNYSTDPEQTFKLGGKVNDNCDTHRYNYTYILWASHEATNLQLDSRGGVFWNDDDMAHYSVDHYTRYQRSYLPQQITAAFVHLDLENKTITAKKTSNRGLTYFWGTCDGEYPVFTATFNTSHENNDGHCESYLNIEKKLVKVNYNMTTDGSQSFHVYGIIPDARSALFDVWRDYEDIRISDVAYYLRLNHSRLIVSRLFWRPDLIQDIKNGLRNAVKNGYDAMIKSINETREYIREEIWYALRGVWEDAKPSLQEYLNDIKSLKVIYDDIEKLKAFLAEAYNNNEFYMKDIYNMLMYMSDELALKAQLEKLPAVFKEFWDAMGESGKKLQKSIQWIIEKIKLYYENASEFIKRLLEGDPIEYLGEAIRELVEKYDELIKELHISFLKYMESLWMHTYAMIIENWNRTLAALEPTVLRIIQYIEGIWWNTSAEFLDFLYARRNEIIESPYFTKFAEFTHDLDKFYKDITGNKTISSIVKYSRIAWDFLKKKFLEIVPFAKEVQDIVNEIIEELAELKKLPAISWVCDKLDQLYNKLKWFYEYFDMESRFQKLLVLIQRKLFDMTQTALEIESKYREAKTKFYFQPSEGIMDLEQKLPMSWHAFNETPKFQEIPELKLLYTIQNYFTASQASFWNFYYDYKPYTDPTEWLPPFKGQALIAGPKYYVTFDRQYYEFRGSCSYVLATDLLDRNFTVAVSYDALGKTHELLLMVNSTIIRINVFNDTVMLDNSDNQFLPITIGDTNIYWDSYIVTVESDSGFVLECNMKFDICIFEISGWYFGKTAGLWGTLNNEPSDDLLSSDKRKVRPSPSEVAEFARSWSLDSTCSEKKLPPPSELPTAYQAANARAQQPEIPPADIVNLCGEIFQSRVSQLTACFQRVDPQPFLAMCLNGSTELEACTAAVAYINLCGYANTPLRIPDSCIKCELPNGSLVSEGAFVRLEDRDVLRSADIVFIIEAKECNKNARGVKHLDDVLELIDKELNLINITNNRYSLVVFGGEAVYDRPRSVVTSSHVFTDHQRFKSYLDHYDIGDGTADIFAAITFATGLLFRPGASKVFILLPCSECLESNMKLDYAILHQLLFENNAKLHILMDADFHFTKNKEHLEPFGIDRSSAYTKKDIRLLRGDSALRRQISLPKSTLGFCASLALETNGTVFSSKHLTADKKNTMKKFMIVFSKRVAASASPSRCMDCECTAPNTGVSYMECLPCLYPTDADYIFDEDEALSMLQPGDNDDIDFFE